MEQSPGSDWPNRLLALVVAALLSGTAHAQAPATVPVGPATMTIAVGQDYALDSTSEQTLRQDMQVLRQAGVKRLRFCIAWDDVEHERDRYNWTLLDLIVRVVGGEFGMELIPFVCHTPAWNSPGTPQDYFAKPPRDLGEFEQFMFDLADRYKADIHAWEIWNEPDSEAFWDGSAPQYAELLKAAARAARRADPNAKIISGGLSWDTDWLAELLRSDPDVAASIDAIGLHCYYETFSSERIEQLHSYIGQAREAARRFAQGEPIWITEIGYGSGRAGEPTDQDASEPHEHTERYQGAALLRMLSECASEGVELVAWSQIRDQRDDADPGRGRLGLVRWNHDPKPSLQALSFTVRLLGQPLRCIDGQVSLTAPLSSRAHFHAFEQTDGQATIIGWLRPHYPGDAPGGERERVSLIIPGERQGEAIVSGASGTGGGKRDTRTQGGQTFLRSVPLGADAVTVLRLGPPTPPPTTVPVDQP
jgi:GH35 family endo-1,4-beta-xylanase